MIIAKEIQHYPILGFKMTGCRAKLLFAGDDLQLDQYWCLQNGKPIALDWLLLFHLSRQKVNAIQFRSNQNESLARRESSTCMNLKKNTKTKKIPFGMS